MNWQFKPAVLLQVELGVGYVTHTWQGSIKILRPHAEPTES